MVVYRSSKGIFLFFVGSQDSSVCDSECVQTTDCVWTCHDTCTDSLLFVKKEATSEEMSEDKGVAAASSSQDDGRKRRQEKNTLQQKYEGVFFVFLFFLTRAQRRFLYYVLPGQHASCPQLRACNCESNASNGSSVNLAGGVDLLWVSNDGASNLVDGTELKRISSLLFFLQLL